MGVGASDRSAHSVLGSIGPSNPALAGRPTCQPARSVERVLGETEVADNPSADEVLLDDALDVLGRDVPVPSPLRIHDADRARGADAQALAFRPVERTVRAGQVQLLQALLQVVPGLVPLVGVDAVGTDADEQVPRQLYRGRRSRDRCR